MLKYQNNTEFVSLFQEFAKVMGGHFEHLDLDTNKNENKIPDSQ